VTVTPVESVQAPPLVPPAYGILSAARLVEGGRVGFGFDYQPEFCGAAKLGVAACATPVGKAADDGRDLVEGEPFSIYTLKSCQTIGFPDAQQFAQNSLLSGEGRAVEEWLGEKLVAEANTNNGTWTEATTLDALGAIEHYIHCNYGGVGTIHMQRGTATGLLAAQALETNGTGLFTKLGNKVSAGCYNVGSGDTIWATGTVTLQRGPVITPGGAVIDTTTNIQYALAERLYAGAWECFAIGVTVA